MDAVIARHKPHQRTAAPSRTPWSAWSAPQQGPSDHRWHLTSPEQLATASSRIVIVSPQNAWWVLGSTIESLARHGHPVLLIEVGATSSASARTEAAASHRPAAFSHQTLRFDLTADTLALQEKTLAEWLPLGSGDTVFVPWRHDGLAAHEACARATLAACRTVNARCIEYPVHSLDASHQSHSRLRRSVLQCVKLPQLDTGVAACEWTLA